VNAIDDMLADISTTLRPRRPLESRRLQIDRGTPIVIVTLEETHMGKLDGKIALVTATSVADG